MLQKNDDFWGDGFFVDILGVIYKFDIFYGLFKTRVGPINAHLTIAPGITTTMKNKKHYCNSFVKISAVAQQ